MKIFAPLKSQSPNLRAQQMIVPALWPQLRGDSGSVRGAWPVPPAKIVSKGQHDLHQKKSNAGEEGGLEHFERKRYVSMR